jgi:hypothetical protein
MRTVFVVVSSMLFATAALAQAQPQQVSAQPAVATSTPEQAAAPDKITCHHQIHEGQLVDLVDCKDQKGWNAVKQRTRNDFAAFQYRALSQRGR